MKKINNNSYISSLNKKIFDLENNIKEMNINFDNKLKKIEQKHKEEIQYLINNISFISY